MTKNTYIIHVHTRDTIYDQYKYHATFDNYDPTPIDHDTPAYAPLGCGDTELEAIYDLVESAYEHEELQQQRNNKC